MGGGPSGNGGGSRIGGGTCATAADWLTNRNATETNVVKDFIEVTSFLLAPR
ncbi:hypothetical protein ABIA16_000659 [Sinorhizobium fredii]